MTDDLITTDHPLNADQQAVLTALLDTLIPPSDDGLMPGAGSLDLVRHLREGGDNNEEMLVGLVDQFDAAFSTFDADARESAVQAFSTSQPELFEWLLMNTYMMYYKTDQVLEGIGMSAGPPFPRGNTIIDGDISSLDRVVERGKSYRPA